MTRKGAGKKERPWWQHFLAMGAGFGLATLLMVWLTGGLQ